MGCQNGHSEGPGTHVLIALPSLIPQFSHLHSQVEKLFLVLLMRSSDTIVLSVLSSSRTAARRPLRLRRGLTWLAPGGRRGGLRRLRGLRANVI